MLLVLYLIVLFVMNFIYDNTLEGNFGNRRYNPIFHVTCYELYTFVCNLSIFYGVNFSGFGGLEVACWPLVPKFAGSNPAEFFRAKKSSARLPLEGK